jgi:hypothetical protein
VGDGFSWDLELETLWRGRGQEKQSGGKLVKNSEKWGVFEKSHISLRPSRMR